MDIIEKEYSDAMKKLGYPARVVCPQDEWPQYAKLDEANELPADVIKSDANPEAYLKNVAPGDEELIKKLVFIQNVNAARNIRTIKNCVVFFTILVAVEVFFAVLLPLL